MHANTALPCAWALGTLLVLTGCASRGASTAHPLDLPVARPVVASHIPPAVRAPSPPSVTLLRPEAAPDATHRAVPLGRHETLQPALAAPVLRTRTQPAPCALPPELSVRRPLPRAASTTYDVPRLFEQARLREDERRRARSRAPLDVGGGCAGGT